MKYRIDAVVAPTDLSLDGYETNGDIDRTTTKATDVDGLESAITMAKGFWAEMAPLGGSATGVYVIDEMMNIVATVNADNPNG